MICRSLPDDDNRKRALLLRDPTPSGSAEPIHFLRRPTTEMTRRGDMSKQWLPDWRYQFAMPDSDHLNNLRYTRVSVERNEGERLIKFQVSRAAPLRNAKIRFFEAFDKVLDESSSAQDKIDVTASFSIDATAGQNSVLEDQGDSMSEQTEDNLVDVGSPGISALLEVFWSDLDLVELAELGLEPNGSPGSVTLAVLSGMVFDLDGKLTDASDLTARLEEFAPGDSDSYRELHEEQSEIKLDVLVPKDQVDSLPLPLLIDQSRSGCRIRVDWDKVSSENLDTGLKEWKDYCSKDTSKDVVTKNIEDYTLVLYRAVGLVAKGTEEELGRFPPVVEFLEDQEQVEAGTGKLPYPTEEKWRQANEGVFDGLGETRYSGERLHYRLELRNVVDQIVATGSIAEYRLRLDPPPPPLQAQVCVNKDNQISFEIEVPEGEEASVKPYVLFQKRPLDACGFYGTDDDLSLEEGLRQADLNFDKGTGIQDYSGDWSEHPAFQSMQGKYQNFGLNELDIGGEACWQVLVKSKDGNDESEDWQDVDNISEQGRYRVVASGIPLPELNDGNQPCGFRFYAGLRRISGDDKRLPESQVELCAHFLAKTELQDNKRRDVRQRVFQLERLPEVKDSRSWIEKMSALLVDDGRILSQPRRQPSMASEEELEQRTPYKVRVSIDGTSASHGESGGFRIYARDILGDNDRRDFTPIGEFEAVSIPIYRYRPYQFDGRKVLVADAISANWEITKPGASTEDADKMFQSFAEKLSSRSGTHSTLGRLVSEPGLNLNTGVKPDEIPSRLDAKELKYATAMTRNLNEALKAIDEKISSLESLATYVTSETKKDEVSQLLRGSWPLLGPFLGWAVESGFARDLILPFSVSKIQDINQWFVEFTSNFPGNVRVFVSKFTPPAAQALAAESVVKDLVLATVRILVVPNEEELSKAVSDNGLRSALKIALSGENQPELRVFQEKGEIPEWLVLDSSGWASLLWDGIQDKWHHRLEFAAERLDRYERAHAFFNMATSSVLRPVSSDTPGSKISLEVPRREPAPSAPGIMAANDPVRVKFNVTDSVEREESTHNALVRMRYGDVVLKTRLLCQFPWAETYAAAPETWPFQPYKHESPTVTKPGDEQLHSWADWNGTDEIEEPDAPYFLVYRREVRWQADDEEGEVSHASWQRRPAAMYVEENTAYWNLDDVNLKWKLCLPIVCLGHLLSDEESQHPDAKYALDSGKPVGDLPDLQTKYVVYRKLNNSSAFSKFVELTGPGFESPLLGNGSPYSYQLQFGTPLEKDVELSSELAISQDSWEIAFTPEHFGPYRPKDAQWLLLISRDDMHVEMEIKVED
ncbi:hypothetical protein [Thalassotalea atypica]|uniref:hypothetical protein n=1 Tax=Thalassotalea atypica TaxID=2054316 RepID=UPI00257255EE|nr:hypothetical protein [Thalassotalea atypica]